MRLCGFAVVTVRVLAFLIQLLCFWRGFQLEASSLFDGPEALARNDELEGDRGSLFASLQGQSETTLNDLIDEETKRMRATQTSKPGRHDDRRLFVVNLLRMLHEQYGGIKKGAMQQNSSSSTTFIHKKEDQQANRATLIPNHAIMSQLLIALGADGDVRRLIDWIQNSFNLASIGELTTQFVVSKLGSVNCAAILTPDREETLVPRFLLFNEHFVDVPFELSIQPSRTECLADGSFDPLRKTVILMHGYLAGYTIVDGLTNIKNRLLDLNKLVNRRALKVFAEAAKNNATSYLLTEDLELKVRQQQYNVIIVDWFNGANPVPRSNYIRAATNAQVVGKLIARFLSALIVQCHAPARSIQIIAHSLGCHVAGFTGKAMNAAGHRLGKITHLDPIGLCFGRLFSEPRYRLDPNDALDTQAVHVSLNIFDNPLDGAQSNFLVNGGRDQLGCGGQSELQNSTSSSVSLLYDSEAKFTPCSHVRSLSLFEDDLSSEPTQCQIVGYRCDTYERFLAGKCGTCDAQNNQCRLMSLAPFSSQFRRITFKQIETPTKGKSFYKIAQTNVSTGSQATKESGDVEPALVDLVRHVSNGSIAWLIDDQELNLKIGSTIAKLRPELAIEKRDNPKLAGRMDETMEEHGGPGPKTRVDRRLSGEQRARLAQTIDKIRSDTRNALADGLSAFRMEETRYKVSSMIGKSPLGVAQHLPSLSLNPFEGLRHLSAVVGGAAASVTSGTKILGSPETGLDHSIPKPEPPLPLAPLGGQALPAGSENQPLYFVGTGAVSPYCVNYYQFKVLISESRINRQLLGNHQASQDGLRVAHISAHNSPGPATGETPKQRQAVLNKDKLHLTIKLTDSEGHFFKGFTLVEDARTLVSAPVGLGQFGGNKASSNRVLPGGTTVNMVELTMLLNTTRLEPVRISETIISYYFHNIVLADMIEINFMSNISPEVRSRYSSVLCPIQINDGHHLVRYIECAKIGAKK